MSQTYAMNPDTVKREGVQLQDNAANLLAEINKLTRSNDALKQVWKGNGSEAYFAKWEEKKDSIVKLQNWLNGFADATVSSAELAQRTDSDVSGMMN